MFSIVNRLAPALMDQLSKSLIPQSFREESPRRPEGALHQMGQDGATDGDHPGMVRETSFYTRASLHPGFSAAIIVAVGVALTALIGGGAKPVRKSWF